MFFDGSFRFKCLIAFGLIDLWNFTMVKERVNARQLADMITEKIGIRNLEIVVHEDHAFGWLPNVVSAPGDLIGYQRRAEEIANRLRMGFDLRD
jgi:hypothetical protein